MSFSRKVLTIKTLQTIPNSLTRSILLKTQLWLCLALAGCFASPTALLSQDLQIMSVDSSKFPEIKVSVVYKGKSRFGQQDLNIKQGGKELTYTIRESAPGSAPEKGRAVFFLIEGSGNTYGKTLTNFREGILSAFDNLENNDIVNAGSFGSSEIDSIGLRVFSKEFTRNHGTIREALNTRLSAVPDSLSRSDLYKSIVDALAYIKKQDGLPQNKIFIVLSNARNNSKSPATSADCIARAKEMGIPIYSITYLNNDSAYSSGTLTRISERTGGKNITAKSQIDIINGITDFFNLPVPTSMQEAAYDLLFDVLPEPENPKQIKIDIKFRGTRQLITVTDPSIATLIPEDIKKYLWLSIGILGVIVVFMILVNLFSRRKNKKGKLREQDLSEENSATPKNPLVAKPENSGIQQKLTINEPFAEAEVLPPPVKTGVPLVLVSLNGRTQTYPLSKNETTLGRHESNDIYLPEQTVTGRHAKITIENGVIEIHDLGSTNGTFVNDERIRTHVLKHGDRIGLGQVELTLKE